MNLNKPPITEEQTTLEEYVDFLLTDRSNVTPINQRAKKITVIHDKNRDIIASDNKEEIFAQLKPVISNNEPEPKLEKKVKISESVVQSEKTLDKINKQDKPLEDKPIESYVEELSNKIKPKFVAESEEEELKKWDLILTREKELEILANEAKNFNKNILQKKNRTFEKKLDDRPAVFNETLPVKELDERLVSVEKLLSRISLVTQAVVKPVLPKVEVLARPEIFREEVLPEVKVVTEITAEAVEATFLGRAAQKTKDILPEVFQTLIFNVGKLPLAVPLLKLGGIVHINEKQDITPLVGTPDWFMGLMPHERGNLMVIDTQKYLMPEKNISNEINKAYEYLIILDNSNWALACHSVGEAKNLTFDDVRWSAKSSKRPWFGGMVVEFMSAIIEVDELINMLASNIVD